MKNVLVLGLLCVLAGCSSSGGDDGQGGGQAFSGAGAAQPPPKAGSATPAATPAKPTGKIVPILCTLEVGGGATKVDLVSDGAGSLTGSASAPDDDGTMRKWDVSLSGSKDGDFTTFEIDLDNDNGPVARTANALGAVSGPNFPTQLLQFFNHSRNDEVDVACVLNGE